ncbi:MAG TPA: indole-3-glycerol phosphate synthase TrpC [Phycisphaerae bacterium]|nr:indole-3-glycerol phosphate synthase TrpC [Phycisphaerae bacterium]
MGNILDRIIETKRAEVAASRALRPLADVRQSARDAEPPRDFHGALFAPAPHGIHVIAEIKKKSPSAGLIRAAFDPVAIARIYHAHGAAALSVLTDEPYFDGRLEYIASVRSVVPLPVLRKDFIIDPYQVYEARAAGADAILLIGEILSPLQVREMLDLSCELGMSTLIEVHEEETLAGVLQAVRLPGHQRALLGINNRNLKIQRIDLATTERLARLIPDGTLLVSESGVKTHDDVRRLIAAGARAILIGETLMRSPNIGAALDTLLDNTPRS